MIFLMNKKHLLTEAEALARDPGFRNWILHPDSEVSRFWSEFQLENPSETEKILLAKEIVLFTARRSENLDEPHKQQLHQNLMLRIAGFDRRRLVRRAIVGTAAAMVLLFTAYSYLQYPGGKMQPLSYQAPFGQRKAVVLPDSSLVELNANSELKLGNQWHEGIREVWLNGEAYFDVKKKPINGNKFTVHTAGLDVEVLGTHFNVNSRDDETQVFLEEGKVRLLVKEPTEAIKELYLDPGDLAHIGPKSQQIIRQTRDQAKSVTSWKGGYLVYRNATLAEVIKDIHNTYGKRVRVDDQILLTRRINGAIPTDDLEEFINVAELLFGVEVRLQNDELLFIQTG